MALFLYNSLVFGVDSCKVTILQYKWNSVNSKCICVLKHIVHSFLYLYWRYKCVDKDRQQNPPSLLFARPRAKAKTLVVDQDLLLCRLYFKGARFITKFFSVIRINWHDYSPIIIFIPMGLFSLLQVLGGCRT